MNVGRYQTDVSFVYVSENEEEPLFRIDSCAIVYKPFELLMGNIQAVYINGVSVVAKKSNEGLQIPILDLFQSQTPNKSKTNSGTAAFRLNQLNDIPITVNVVSINGNTIVLSEDKRTVAPFALKMNSEKIRTWEKFTLSGNTSWDSNEVSFNAKIDSRLETVSGNIFAQCDVVTKIETSKQIRASAKFDSPFSGTMSYLNFERDIDATVRYNDSVVANISLSPNFTNDVISVKSKFDVLGIVGNSRSEMNISQTRNPTVKNTVEIPNQAFSKSDTLCAIVGGIDDFDFGGNISATLKYDFRKYGTKGVFEASLSEGYITSETHGLSVSGLRIKFGLPNLPTLKSDDAHFLAFKEFRAGKIHVNSGTSIFRMLSPSVWYLDNTVVNWCGGKIRMESARLSPENERTWLTLHCDRVKIAEVLEQFGVGVDTGSAGTLNGTLPMMLDHSGIHFRDGYLYSTPGETGRISLIPSDAVKDAAGSATETSLAVDAMSDFKYSWVRMGFNSFGDALQVKFEVDGKPENKLHYSVSGGAIVRTVFANEFKGIKLDATFNIPINEGIKIFNVFNNMGM